MAGMKCRPDMAGLACEALNRMFQKEQTELVSQVDCKHDPFFILLNMSNKQVVMITLFTHGTGSESGAGSLPPEAAGRSRPGDTRQPFGYKGPDRESSQVHDS